MKKLLLSLLAVVAFSATSFVEAKKQDPSDVCATQRGCKNCKCDDSKMCATKGDCNKAPRKSQKSSKPTTRKKMSEVVSGEAAVQASSAQ